jgi:hypothetical protein
MEILLILFSCAGLTLILKYGKPTKFIREYLSLKDDRFKYLFKCSLCLGFWSGILHSTIYSLFYLELSFVVLLLPAASAVFSLFMDSAIQCIQMIEIYLKS